ncbi:hypothetical protein [Dokdonella sp.]|uniref:hypothetical protein n=1 Tax=Dokdonella sp. TaxID=2291710 RepID=UPI0025B9B84E|nr:hypothetical protein [Dokdonella sp.]
MISVLDLSAELGRRKQTLFKVIQRLNIDVVKQPGIDSRGQIIAFVTPDDAQRIRDELALRAALPSTSRSAQIMPSDAELGYFYLIALEPEHDKGRFKVGFATVLGERIQKHRCSAPLLELVASWPCKRLWEKTAIDAVTFDCERIHTEVFRTHDFDAIRERCEQFFSIMPAVPSRGSRGAP